MKAEVSVGRVVIDTNVLISAALSPMATPARLTWFLVRKATVLFSAESFAELESRLWKPKFDRYISPERRERILLDFSAIALWVELPPPPRKSFCRDPDDDVLVQTALTGQARWLISGDGDLLEMPPIASLQILSPASAWALFSSEA